MPFATRQVRRALVRKHGFVEDTSGPHRVFKRWHQGRLIGITELSHGASGRDVSETLLGLMAKELGVRGPEFRGAIDCRVDPNTFLSALLKANA